MSTSSSNPPPGFTLIEILVSVFIVGLMSIVSVVQFRAAARTSSLRHEAALFASVLRQVQNQAVAHATLMLCRTVTPPTACNQTTPDCPFGTTCDDVRSPSGGYGVNLVGVPANSYRLYADLDGDGHFVAANDALIKDGTRRLENQVQIVTQPTFDATFTPPRGRLAGSSDATFILQRADVPTCRSVKVIQLTGQIQEAVVPCP